MHVHELRKRFIEHKNYAAEDVNELLDFARKAYIFNEIASSEYKILVRDLEALGAKFPYDEFENNYLIKEQQD